MIEYPKDQIYASYPRINKNFAKANRTVVDFYINKKEAERNQNIFRKMFLELNVFT